MKMREEKNNIEEKNNNKKPHSLILCCLHNTYEGWKRKKALLKALMATSCFKQGIAAYKEAEDDGINTEVHKVWLAF